MILVSGALLTVLVYNNMGGVTGTLASRESLLASNFKMVYFISHARAVVLVILLVFSNMVLCRGSYAYGENSHGA